MISGKNKIPADVSKETQRPEWKEPRKRNLSWAGIADCLGIILRFRITVQQSASHSLYREIFSASSAVLFGYAFRNDNRNHHAGALVSLHWGIVIKNEFSWLEFYRWAVAEACVQDRQPLKPERSVSSRYCLRLLQPYWDCCHWPLVLISTSSLFQHLNPHIFFGGDSVVFWGHWPGPWYLGWYLPSSPDHGSMY